MEDLDGIKSPEKKTRSGENLTHDAISPKVILKKKRKRKEKKRKREDIVFEYHFGQSECHLFE